MNPLWKLFAALALVALTAAAAMALQHRLDAADVLACEKANAEALTASAQVSAGWVADARELENERTAINAKIDKMANDDRARARLSAERLRDAIDALDASRAAARRDAAAAAAVRDTACAPADLPADLLRRLAGMAQFADLSHRAGAACAKWAESMSASANVEGADARK
jgi:Skp family chaperone for outer membrane proteins